MRAIALCLWVGLVPLAVTTGVRAEPIDADEARARLGRAGCLGCHSTTGAGGAGPTLAGLFGSERILSDGRVVVADADYLRRAILEPEADVPADWEGAAMPAFNRLDDATVEQLVEAIGAIGAPDAPPEQRLWIFALGIMGFVLLHFVLSSSAIRAALVRRLGEGRFMGVYALAVGAPFVVMLFAWSEVPWIPLWEPPRWASHLALTLMLPALYLLVAGYSTKSPTAAGAGSAAAEPPRGVITITRHPALWGFALWALAHLISNGTVRDLLLFGGILILAVGGMLHIDARRRAASPETWSRFAAQTSLVPFAAILRGRTKLDVRGMLPRLLVAIVLYGALVLALHRWLIGVPALPPQWGIGW